MPVSTLSTCQLRLQNGEVTPEFKKDKTHCPSLYKDSNGWQRGFNLKALDLLQMSFVTSNCENRQFLDLGCGTGDFTRDWLRPRCPPCRRVVAVDVSADMVAYAKRHSAHPKIVYDLLDIRGKVTGFVRKYGQFERIYSFFCLQWAKDQEVAFKNIAELMAPGGECLLMFPARTPPFYLWRRICEEKRWRRYAEVGEGTKKYFRITLR